MNTPPNESSVDSLDDLLAYQCKRDAGHVHLVHIGRTDFRLAHTDDERAGGMNTETCIVHRWLTDMSGPPARDGVYVVMPYTADAYSEAYPVPPFELLSAELVDFDALREDDNVC